MLQKFIFIFIFALTSTSYARNVFEATTPIKVKITAPLKSLFEKKNYSMSLTANVNGTLEVKNETTSQIETYDIQIAMRGNSSLSMCQFPKLKIRFKKEQTTKKRVFNRPVYDIATHCIDNKDDLDNVIADTRTMSSPHREKFIFDLQSELGLPSPLTRNAIINYIDITDLNNPTVNVNRPAFFIENTGTMIKRLNGLYSIIGKTDVSKKNLITKAKQAVDDNPPRALFDNLSVQSEINAEDVIKLHLLHLLILNADFYIKLIENDPLIVDGYGTLGFWNVKAMAITDKKWIVYSNDFNLAQLLADHDQANKQHKSFFLHYDPYIARKTSDRLSLIGTAENRRNVINFFMAKKDDLYSMLEQLQADPVFQSNVRLYLDNFYEKLILFTK